MSPSKLNLTTKVVKKINAHGAGLRFSGKFLALIPAIFALTTIITACGDNKVIVPTADDGLVSTKVTMGKAEPIWPNDDPSIPDGGGDIPLSISVR